VLEKAVAPVMPAPVAFSLLKPFLDEMEKGFPLLWGECL
jgi:hypothetical protein